jgi:ATP-dependent helicase HrpA
VDIKTKKIKQLKSMLPKAMIRDRLMAERQLQRLQKRVASATISAGQAAELSAVEKRIERSIARRIRRLKNRPIPTYPPELPITSKKDEIIAAIIEHPVVIVSGETGSGKTTQIHKFCLEAGRGSGGRIGCTQPRRIAASSVALRIAEELGQELGRSVGYQIRFQDRTQPDGLVKIMTDGILLAEAQRDPLLSAYDTIIVDEAHERSLNIDFILGILKTLLGRRDDLKVIITSATIDTEKFSQAFDHAPVIEVSGRTYPVDIRYVEGGEDGEGAQDAGYVEAAAAVVRRIERKDPQGDILVFMPTEQDIRDACDLIAAGAPHGALVLPLFARLSAAEQQRVFRRASKRKIIVATNVAETSITIPGIRYVVDTGLARISRYSPRTRTIALPVTAISRSSADQRAGRCGRVQNGICYRLYSEEDYRNRLQFTPPEIVRANLAEVILRMIDLRLGDIGAFAFVDPPDPKHIRDGINLLFELGALQQHPRASASEAPPPRTDGLRLTRTGRLMARLPLDPRLARMLIEGQQHKCLADIVVIAAALTIADPRERPAERTAEADRAHAGFADPVSDFVTLLNIWNRYHHLIAAGASSNLRRRFCRDHFLSFKRMREWQDIHRQIGMILKDHGISFRPSEETAPAVNLDIGPEHSRYEAIHKSILSGFLSNIAQRKEKMFYLATKGREAMIFPGSGLFAAPPPWLVAAEMVETSRLFARKVARIDSSWLELVGADLCRRVYLNPRWDRGDGRVVATEQVSLFGLIIAADRKVPYGPIEPKEATGIFIRNALVEARIDRLPAFLRHNQGLVEKIRGLEDRLRRRDLLVSDEAQVDFYRERLARVYDLRTLSRLVRQRGTDRFLRMSEADLMNYDPAENELIQYPRKISLGNRRFDCTYRFEPGHEQDGVTLKVPVQMAPALEPDEIDWLVPGLLREKITCLIRGLPKSLRKQLVPVQETVDTIMDEMPAGEGALLSALAAFIHRRYGLNIPADAWPEAALAEHLKMRIAITAPGGKVLRAGRDKRLLCEPTRGEETTGDFERYRRQWERLALTSWDFGDLPQIVGPENSDRSSWVAYPALQKEEAAGGGAKISLRLFQSRQEALQQHAEGVTALAAIVLSQDLKFLRRQMVLPADVAGVVRLFGGARAFESALVDTVLHRFFEGDVRTASEFQARIEAAKARMMATGRDCLAKLLPLLQVLETTRGDLSRLAAAGPATAPFFQARLTELDRLVPVNFLRLYDSDRFADIERYIRALGIRAQRAQVDFEKDRTKAAQMAPLIERFQAQLGALNAGSTPEKRAALEDVFWMLEEYKVSVFAQELKTAFPVSAKRVSVKLAQIERMV